MRFKIGQIIRIKSLEWFDENSDHCMLEEMTFGVDRGSFKQFAGKEVEIANVDERDNSIYVKVKNTHGVYAYLWLPMRSVAGRKKIRKAKVRF